MKRYIKHSQHPIFWTLVTLAVCGMAIVVFTGVVAIAVRF